MTALNSAESDYNVFLLAVIHFLVDAVELKVLDSPARPSGLLCKDSLQPPARIRQGWFTPRNLELSA